MATAAGLVLAGDRDPQSVAFEAEMVGFFVDAAELLGVPKSVAAIYGIIFASPVPLSFSEIEERLAISKGSVSQGLRVLRDVGAIKEAQGSKLTARSSLAYEPDLELRKLVAHFLETRLETQLKASSSKLKILAQTMPVMAEAEGAKLRTRLKSLSDWHKKASSLLPLARTVLKLGV